jgi:hypothetical protein
MALNRFWRWTLVVLVVIAVGGIASTAYLIGRHSGASSTAIRPKESPQTAAASTSTTAPGISPVGNQPELATCGQPQFEPSSILLDCGAGGVQVTDIVWSTWNTTELGSGPLASGSGQFNWDDCVPNCAQGETYSDPVMITLSNPVSYQGSEVWGTIEVDDANNNFNLPGDLATPPSSSSVVRLVFSLPM